MSRPVDWARAYARQADADFHAWELFERFPEAVAADCHRLLFLQMACEKLCKARLIQDGTTPESLQTSHGFVANPLPNIIRGQILFIGGDPRRFRNLLTDVRHLAGEIEVLNPAMRRDGYRPDNCEYPWEAGGEVQSPLDWTFHPLRFVTAPAGRTFIKLLRGSIDRLLSETES